MADVGQVHWTAGKRDRNRGGDFQSLAVLGGEQQGEEGIVVHLCRAHAVIAGSFDFPYLGRNLLQLMANACIDFHLLPDSFQAAVSSETMPSRSSLEMFA